jgi:hypothetical protein
MSDLEAFENKQYEAQVARIKELSSEFEAHKSKQV